MRNSMVSLLLVLAVTGSIPGVSTFVIPACSLSGQPVKDCIHLTSINGMKTIFTVGKGEYSYFHWVMTDFSTVIEERGQIAIVASPCSGEIVLLVTPGTALSFPIKDSTSWRSSNTGVDNVLLVEPKYGSYLISVFGETNATFQVGVFPLNESRNVLSMGDDGNVKVTPQAVNDVMQSTDTVSMDVSFRTTKIPNAKYALFSVEHSKRDDVCSMTQKTLRPELCITQTYCGIQITNTSKQQTEFDLFPVDKTLTLIANELIQTLNYTFNIVLETPEGLHLCYSGTEGKPTFDRVTTSVNSGTTVIIIVTVVVVVVVALLLIVILKRKLSHSFQRGKGLAQSSLPYKRTPPSWLKATADEVESHVCRLAKKGCTPSQIGVILRDSDGIAQVKSVTGSKILRILKRYGLAPTLPEDLYSLIKRAVSVRKHLEKNRKDKDSKFRLILVESRIHRLSRYYKRTKQLPPTWKYESATASTLVA